MDRETDKFSYDKRYSFLWLVIFLVLFVFSSGKFTMPLPAWLFAIFGLRFFRTQQRCFMAFVFILLAIAVGLAISLRGVLNFPMQWYIVFVIIYALPASLPFVADRLLSSHLRGVWATLVFPLSFTALEFLNNGFGNPMGSWGAIGYSQYGSQVLLQIVSITGLWGLSFLMSWFASIINWIWEQNFDWFKIRRGVALYCGIFAMVLVYGGVRLKFAHLEPGTVRVASLTAASIDVADLMNSLKNGETEFSQKTSSIHSLYFNQTIKEARAGAKIILWSEGAGIGLGEDEAELMTRAREISQQENIYLAIPFFTIYTDKNRPIENKLIIFNPSGNQAMEHIKYGGNFLEGSKKGDGILKALDTPYGKLSGAICWDTDFVKNIAQSGRNGSDILLSPAHDWREIDPLHGQMTVFRAIENGITVIRQADLGFSIVTDPYGRTLAAIDHYTADERTMIAQVPTKGIRTIYSIIGDIFGWLSIVGFFWIAAWSVIRKRKGL
jgi:apolipoprotein N-acyltransferase